MNKLFLLALSCIFVTALQAQDSSYKSTYHNNKKADKKARINRMIKMEEEGELIFNKQNIFGIKLATDGYGVFFEKGYFKTPTKTSLLQFELNEKKSPKEYRLSSGDVFGTSEILYKLNNFYQFKVSVGQQRLIGGKGNKNGVAVTALYTGGISLGLQKPYYYNITYVDVSGYDSGNAQKTWTQLLNDTSGSPTVVGASGFTVGWGHVSLKPGLNAKAALRFDYGRFNTSVTAIEAGINAEFYFSKVEQVYNVPYKNFFFNGYVTIMFGSRK
ncbi:MAG TPA: hypothetical protein VNV85_11420 [Puia sp.]|nr:hypothetical protein [Puia sp.]